MILDSHGLTEKILQKMKKEMETEIKQIKNEKINHFQI